MKRVFILFIASLIVGAIVFAVFYWVLNWELVTAVNVGLSGALGGLVAEFIRLYAEKRKRGNTLRR